MTNKDEFNAVVEELDSQDLLATTIEYGPDNEWLGMVFKKNMFFSNHEEQNHFAICVFDGEKRINQ